MNEPRLTTVMGVARVLIAAVGPRDAARVLVDEFGWDASLQAMAVLRGPEAGTTFGLVWSSLLVDDTTGVPDVASDLEPGER